MAHLLHWVLTQLFEAENYETILYEIISGKSTRLLPHDISLIIARHAPMALVMNDFFKKLQSQSKITPYPSLELEQASK